MKRKKFFSRCPSLLAAILTVSSVLSVLTFSAAAADTATTTAVRNPFGDVKRTAWYAEAALWCNSEGYITGTTSTTFGPDITLSRAMFVQILARFDGADFDEIVYTGRFGDVKADAWYAKAVQWAVNNGITSGVSADAFAPDSPVTREQLVQFFYTYSKYKKYDTSSNITVKKFVSYNDSAEVSSWARTALGWGIAEGLITGTTATRLSPGQNATRGQAAVILKRFAESYVAKQDTGTPQQDSSLKLVTFNVRCVYSGDGNNGFVHRKELVKEKIDIEKPDVVGFQEVIPQIGTYLDENMSDYRFLYTGREDDFDGEGMGLLIRRDTVRLLSLDFFWLSDTPNTPGSRYEKQGSCPRIAQVALLQRKSDNMVFRVVNTHLDCDYDEAREKQLAQILQYCADAQEKYDVPTFIMGDFNATSTERSMVNALNSTVFPVEDLTTGIGGTFHGFGKYLNSSYKIDYILADPETAAHTCTVTKWTDSKDGVYLSDHYPVCIKIDM